MPQDDDAAGRADGDQVQRRLESAAAPTWLGALRFNTLIGHAVEGRSDATDIAATDDRECDKLEILPDPGRTCRSRRSFVRGFEVVRACAGVVIQPARCQTYQANPEEHTHP